LARECGWDKDKIADTLTVQQICRYADIIQEQKNRELQVLAVMMVQAVGCAFGSIKSEDFSKFIRKLGPDDEPESDLRDAGIPFEEN
jgi:hypothetical protein